MSDLSVKEQVIHDMAQTLATEGWCKAYEEGEMAGECDLPWPGGSEITDYAPDFMTDHPDRWQEALAEAEQMYKGLSRHHKGDLAELLERAGLDLDDESERYDGVWKLTMGAIGHGVFWGDSGEPPLSDVQGVDPYFEGMFWVWTEFEGGDSDEDDSDEE